MPTIDTYVSPYDVLFDEKVEVGGALIIAEDAARGPYNEKLTEQEARRVARLVLLAAQRVEANHA